MAFLTALFIFLGIVAWIISAIFSLDFEVVFLRCIIVFGFFYITLFIATGAWKADFPKKYGQDEEARKRAEELRRKYSVAPDDDVDESYDSSDGDVARECDIEASANQVAEISDNDKKFMVYRRINLRKDTDVD